MTETIRLRLPLVQAAQAQKHITVNEAFARIDALAQLVIASRSIAVPPGAASEGDVYAIGAGAVNGWAGQSGRLAVFVNGGWDFLIPQTGWRAWIADEGVIAHWNGSDWVAGALATSPSGSAFVNRVIEFDHVVTAGTQSTTDAIIPAGCFVFGVTGLVISAITGTATSFQLGVLGESPDRYGAGIGTAQGAWLRGLTSAPLAYYSGTALTLTAEGGTFDGGRVRLAVHTAELTLPSA